MEGGSFGIPDLPGDTFILGENHPGTCVMCEFANVCLTTANPRPTFSPLLPAGLRK